MAHIVRCGDRRAFPDHGGQGRRLAGGRQGWGGALAVELENSLWELSDVYLSAPLPRVLTALPAALLGATRLVFLLLCSEDAPCAAGGEGCLSQDVGTTLGRTLGH